MKKLYHVLLVGLVIGTAIALKANNVFFNFHVDFKFDINPGDMLVGCAATLAILGMFNYTRKAAAEAKRLDNAFAQAERMLGHAAVVNTPHPIAKPVVFKSSDPTPKVDSDKAAAARTRRQEQWRWEKMVPRPGEVQQEQKTEEKPVDILALMYNKKTA